MYHVKQFQNERKHTLCFLNYAKNNAPVTIVSEIDMTNIFSYRDQRKDKYKLSYISFFISEISKVISKNPIANSFYRSGIFPKIVSLEEVNAKFTIDRTISGSQAVVSAIIPNANKISLEEIQNKIHHYKNVNFYDEKDFNPIKILHKTPVWLGQLLFRAVMRRPSKASSLQGSFTITSLGHNPIDFFYPISGSTLTFGIGQIKDRVAEDKGVISIKKTMFLTMVFDHRVMDGALASHLLTEIKNKLEKFSE